MAAPVSDLGPVGSGRLDWESACSARQAGSSPRGKALVPGSGSALIS